MKRCLVILSLLSVTLAAATPPIVDGPWPRAFFFRASEGRARNPRTEYEQWSKEFSRLFGIMGKVFDEEIPNTSQRNIPFFTRFKHDHPDQCVLIHYNGNARDPRVAEEFFAGHWLYRPGGKLLQDLAADPNQTVLKVEDAGQYKLNIGLWDNRNEDLALAPLVDGKLDFFQTEQVQLTAVDAAAGTITVNRGCFGTPPMAFRAGETVVLHHVAEGPWGKNNNLLWYYNWRADCPRDTQGRTATDVFLEEFKRRFGPGGELASVDGVEFDVLSWQHFRVDSDGDNVSDDGLNTDGINAYGLGVYAMCNRLRAALPDKLWMADGGSIRNQRAVGALNGIESEGWPSMPDIDLIDWSAGINRHRYWTQFAAQPRFSYVNQKTESRGKHLHAELNQARLTLAACTLMDSAVTCATSPPGPKGDLPIYDELIAGQDHQPGWLGQAVGEPILLGARGHNLLDGLDLTSQQVQAKAGMLTVNASPGAESLQTTLATLDLPPDDIFVVARLRTQPNRGMPQDVPRLVTVSLRPAGSLLSAAGWQTGMQRRGQPEAELDRTTGATVSFQPTRTLGEPRGPVLFMHPPWRGGAVGRVFAEREVTVPTGAKLSFETGLEQRPGVSDGVDYIVSVRPVKGGDWVEAFNEHRPVQPWTPGEADLAKWAGQHVMLRLTVDCGPQDNTTADQANWASLQLVSPGTKPRETNPLSPLEITTWAGPQWFEAGFFFRAAGPGAAELAVTAEETQPLELAGLAVYNAADVRARLFEHGLVVANPSLNPVEVDLTKLSPGVKYRRLRATPTQDPAVNNGQPCGVEETVGPRDALFLRRLE